MPDASFADEAAGFVRITLRQPSLPQQAASNDKQNSRASAKYPIERCKQS
jgi:hypothetical protein